MGPASTLDQARRALPARPGLYTWWTTPDVLPGFVSPPHPCEPNRRLLYLGIATNLRRRIGQNHLRRSGTSTLRRTLAGLLLDRESLRTVWTDRVVLVNADEHRLTSWMEENLRLTWCEEVEPRCVEATLVDRLQPALNIEHASGDQVDRVKQARARYQASAGPRPT
jgi:hypothetical protein